LEDGIEELEVEEDAEHVRTLEKHTGTAEAARTNVDQVRH
jgi:hypothetical protein